MRDRNLKYTTLDLLVIALCRDYERRKRLIRERGISYRTETEFIYLNYKVLNAARDIAGIRDAEIFIHEIGNKTGYLNTRLSYYSESVYKKYKRAIIENIARALHLCD